MRSKGSRNDRVLAALSRIIETNKASDGSFDTASGGTIHTALADWLEANPETRNHSQEALRIIRDYVQARRPRRRAGQMTLFDPEAVVPLSEDGIEVHMAEARVDHMDHWLEVRTAANARENADFAFDREYILSRRAKFSSPDETLLSVEERHFGWGLSNAA